MVSAVSLFPAKSLSFQSVSQSPAIIRAALWMVFSCAAFACLGAIIRHLGNGGMHALEIVFFRNLFGLLALAPWFWRTGIRGLKTTRLRLQIVRGLIGLVGMTTWFTAVGLIPLAELVALSFTMPLFATVAAIFVLREKVGLRRWSAVFVGFGGAMLILRPGFETLSVGSLLALISACTMAAGVVLIKILTRTENTASIVAWNQIIILPFSALLMLTVWQMPVGIDWLWLALMGAVATAGHLALTRAFTLADATAVMPFDFFRLIFTAVVAYVLFSEVPDIWMWVGAGVIFVSAVYVAHREAQVARQRTTTTPARAGVAEPT